MSCDVRHEARIVLAHPHGWIASGFGSGLSPWASGTTGSAAAVVLFVLCGAAAWPWWLNLLVVGSTFAVGVLSAGWVCRALDSEDASVIVIDEWVGQWLTLSLGLLTWPMTHAWSWPTFLVCGFLLFRLADIVKPWPASKLDRDLGGGLGAMADDAVAGLYSALALMALGWAL